MDIQLNTSGLSNTSFSPTTSQASSTLVFLSNITSEIPFATLNASVTDNGTEAKPTPSVDASKMLPMMPKYDDHWVIGSISVYSILVFLIVIGNALVLIAFAKNRKLRTKTNHFLASLAVADILVGLVSVPIWMYFLISQKFTPLSLFEFYGRFDQFSGVSSILHLMAISLERTYAITRPLDHRSMRKVPVMIALLSIWITATISACIRLPTWKNFAIFAPVVFFCFPLMVIIISYACIFRTAHMSLKSRGGDSMKKEIRTAVTILIVIGLFVLAWAPFITFGILSVYCSSCTFLWDTRITMATKLLHYCNSAVNPIIYAFRNNQFQKSFKAILSCHTDWSKLEQDSKSGVSVSKTEYVELTKTKKIDDEIEA